MKFLLKVALLLVVVILAYNYFAGTQEEKQESQEVIADLKNLGNSVKDLLISEKEKFDEGKYDEAIDKLKVLFNEFEDSIGDLTQSEQKEVKNQVDHIEKEINQLETNDELSSKEKNKLNQLLEEIKKIEQKLNESSEKKQKINE